MVQTGVNPYTTSQFTQNGDAMPLKTDAVKEGSNVGSSISTGISSFTSATMTSNGIEQQNVSIVSKHLSDKIYFKKIFHARKRNAIFQMAVIPLENLIIPVLLNDFSFFLFGFPKFSRIVPGLMISYQFIKIFRFYII